MQVMRAVAAGVYEVRKFLPKLWRMAQELFHEVMGFVFFALTLFFIFGRQGLIRSYQDLESEPGGWGRLLLSAFSYCSSGDSGCRRSCVPSASRGEVGSRATSVRVCEKPGAVRRE